MVDFNPYDKAFAEDPYPIYKALRDEAPVYHCAPLNIWVLSRYDGCWRWLNGREDSPWYPTARILHQATLGAWDEVIERIAEALAALVRAGRPA